MSYNSLFGNSSHPRTNIHNDPVKANLGPKLNDVRDRVHAQQEIPIFDVNNSVTYQAVSPFGVSLLDSTSLADLRTQILESNEEAIRMVPADGQNEINFYTGGTGASNLKMQIKNSSVDLLNNCPLNVNDLNVGLNKSLISDYVGSRAGENLKLRRGSSVYEEYTATTIKPYVSIIPNGVNAQDLGNASNYFGNLHINSVNVKNDIFINFFNSTDIKNDGFYFRSGFGSGSGFQDNMSIRGHNNSSANDGIAISAYGGVSINCGAITATNDNGNDALINRVMLLETNINNYRDMLPYADGAVDIGSASLKFAEIYGNNIRAHTSLYASQIRPYSGSNVHFHNTSITTDNGNSLSVDRVQSTANNRDLFLGTGTTDKIILRNATPIEIYDSIVIGSAPSGLINLGTGVNPFGFVYTTSLSAASSVTAADVEASVSIITRGQNSYMSIEDDTDTNGKVQIISENSTTYTGYISFIKNNIRQLYLGFDNSLQFENGSNFVIRSDQQNYLNFIHDATPANRKIQISCDLLPDFDLFHDLGSASLRYSQIHGNTIFAGTQVATNQITSYDVNEIVNIDSVLRPATNNTRTLGDNTNRWSEVYATNATINTSDRNSKTDIEPIKNGLGLDIVRKLKPVSYKWKENSHGRIHTGFIAQDFVKASPWGDNWSAYVDTGHGLALRYTELISVNTQAIKELDNKVTRLVNGISGETKVDLSVHTPNEELIERLEALENKKPLAPVVEECDHSKLEEEIKQLKIDNKKQEDCINQLISDNMNLTDKLNMLMERFEKFLNDKPNVELKIVDESDILLSEGGGEDHAELIESRLHTLETKVTKISNKQAKLVTAVNKLKK